MKKIWVRVTAPIVIILIWLLLASFGGPTFGKLSSVSSNDQSAFLPSSAQSTKVQSLQSRFATSTSLPAIVILESNSPISQTVFPQFVSLGQKLQAVNGVAKLSQNNPVTIIGPIPSSDNKAVEYIVPVSDPDKLKIVVKDLRTTINDNKPADTTGYVT